MAIAVREREDPTGVVVRERTTTTADVSSKPARRGRRVATPELLVVLAVGFNLWFLRDQRLVVSYPNDSAYHLQMVLFAAHRLSHGILPFSQWYGHLSTGSPFFVQYQSASAVLTGAIGLAVGIPQAFAWSLYLLLALWPLCVYATARLLGWDRWEAGVAALVAPFLFSITGKGFEQQAYTFTGSGLWAELWAMWSLPLAWGLCWRYVSQRKHLFGAVLATALTISFHFLMAYLLALILVVMVLLRPSDLVGRLRRAALVGGAALLSTLWVTVPLLLDAKWTATNEFIKGTAIDDSYGARTVLTWLVHGALFDYQRVPIITMLAAIGLVACVLGLVRDERARVLVAVFVLSLLLYCGRPTLGAVLDLLPGNQVVLFQRYLAGVQLAAVLLAGVGAVAAVRFVASRAVSVRRAVARVAARARAPLVGGALAVVAALVLLAPAWTQLRAYDGRNDQAIAYQRHQDATAGTDANSLLGIVRRDDAGRVFAGLPGPLSWGESFKVGVVPLYNYMEEEHVDEIGLTLATSSLMGGPESLFDENNLGDYSVFGVHDILTPAHDHPPLAGVRAVAIRGPYELWSVGQPGYVQVVDTQGTIADNAGTVGTATADFLYSKLPAEGIYPTIAFDGAAAATPTLPAGAHPRGPPGRVLSQRDDLRDGMVTTVVHATRTAVVVLKAAYDPGWTVSVDGRPAATEMVAPALVAVKVGPGTHRIVFRYEGYSGYLLLFVVALCTLVLVGVGPRLLRRSSARRGGRHTRVARAS